KLTHGITPSLTGCDSLGSTRPATSDMYQGEPAHKRAPLGTSYRQGGIMALLSFLGAIQEVTGSCYLIETHAGARVLLDCGMHQGQRKNEDKNSAPFPFDPSSLDAVVLSHAHIDHSGLLPRLVSQGYRGHIHCTDATAELLELMLLDSANI